jgi:ABC-2 type transport system ATP-binding protein
MADTLIAASALSVRFGSFVALDGIDLDIKRGKILGLLGPSGSGKTTLIRCLAGLHAQSSGQLRRRAPAPRLGYMAQSDALYEDLSGYRNLEYFAAFQGIRGSAAKTKIAAVLELSGLSGHERKLVRHYSGGMRKRLSLAIALVHEPELLILDEPTVGIDPLLRARFWDEFRRLRDSGVTILLSSHAMDEAERCDELALIFDGKLLALDSPRGLTARLGVNSVEEAFLSLRKGERK